MNLSAISNSSGLGRLLRLPLRLVPPDLVVPVIQGPMKGMKWIAGSCTHGCWLGSYEYEKQRLFYASITPGSSVWDIGANVGLYTLLASRKAASVVAVEPVADNIRYLEKHLQLNRIKNVEVVAAAVGRDCSRQPFCRGENRSIGHLGAGGADVEVITLDRMYEKYGPPNLIKIDVEGAECLVLQGAERCLASSPTIFLATHSVELAQQCAALLYAAGYEPKPIDEDEFVFSRRSNSSHQIGIRANL